MKLYIQKILVFSILTTASCGLISIAPVTAGCCDVGSCTTCNQCSPCSPCEQKQALKDAQKREFLREQAAFIDDEGFGDDSFRNDGFGTNFHTCDSCNSLI